MRCKFRSVRVTAVQYCRSKTFGLCAANSGPSVTTVEDARLRPRCEHDFFENMEGFGRGVIVLKAYLFILVSKLKESTKNVSVTSQLLAQVYNSWLYSRQRYGVFHWSNSAKKALNDIFTWHAVRLYRVPGHAGGRGNEITDEFARGGSVLGFLRPEPALGGSRQDIRRRISRWLINQHWVRWRGLGDTQRQARELILEPCLGAKSRFLSFNRTQSRAVTGFLTEHNTLRRHLHLLRWLDSPLCKRCGAEEETSAHILCECEALATLRHVYLRSFFLEPEDIKSVSLGGIWNFSKVTGLP